ncbi:hypothetical protein GCM10023093_17650 [Nemorincola caseinilytica]|uniref:Uncharacterized protein n=1 Tax=Nemorincola caseinilytica TaxID=2054315 RepID=A0ABP8NGL1_9BACT
MTQEQINYFKAAASLGLIHDEENPIFIFNSTHKDLLLDIVSGKIDAVQMARMELYNRGLDENTGAWIGWSKTETYVQK